MRVKRCRSCEDVDVTAAYREDAFVVLCAPCHVDFKYGALNHHDHEAEHPPTLVWHAEVS